MNYSNLSKNELLDLVDELIIKLKKEKESNDFLIGQQKELRRLAEKQGSEKAVWKVKALRLEEKLEKVRIK